MQTNDPRKASDFGKTYARLIADREAHELNDKLVTLNAGARAEATTKGGAAVVGGAGLHGYVWAIAKGKAMCDFGAGLRVVAMVADLTEVST